MILALIPARGLSDRIPYKNLVEFHGRPLIEWTLDAAKQSGVFDAILVSTEDSRVAHVAKMSGVGVLDRPKELAQPGSLTWDTVKHAFDAVSSGFGPKLLVLLQPTSPLRTAEDICNAITLMEHSGADSVVSVTDGQDPRGKMHFFKHGHAGRGRLADDLCHENGAIYMITADAYRDGHDWYSGIMYRYEMPKERSIDIDTLQDLEEARRLMAQREAA